MTTQQPVVKERQGAKGYERTMTYIFFVWDKLIVLTMGFLFSNLYINMRGGIIGF